MGTGQTIDFFSYMGEICAFDIMNNPITIQLDNNGKLTPTHFLYKEGRCRLHDANPITAF